ncbi:MAG: hypothetical protein PF447_14540 [Spirochaetaceae bacterium]|jgi:hypothetical protein|nr:hypothetical protein [Spirochaetaceae bacterium]
MKKSLLWIIYLLALCNVFPQQDDDTLNLQDLLGQENNDSSLSGENENETNEDLIDLDDLFNSNQDVQTDTENQDDSLSVDSLVSQNPFELSANFSMQGGYGWGGKNLPHLPGADAAEEYEDLTLLKMASALTLDFRISPELRVLQKYSMSFPNFDTQVTEFFMDYNVHDKLYMRFGRQNLTWGISRYYPFTNLSARLPDQDDYDDTGADITPGFDGVQDDVNGDGVPDDYSEDADSYSMKFNLPMSTGGLELLFFTRNAFVENLDAPTSDEVGYGFNYNFAVPLFDFSCGTFYHKQLNWRSFYTFNTTLLDRLEFYHEALMSYDLEGDDITPLNYETGLTLDPLDFSVNAGFYVDFFDKKMELSGEYFYCGEETELAIKGRTVPLIWGHNVSGYISYKWGKLKVSTQLQYNINQNSGVVLPGLQINLLPKMSLNLSVPTIFGVRDGAYYLHNPDELNREALILFTVKISGGI